MAITLVQQSGNSGTATASVVVTLSATVAGNLLVLVAGMNVSQLALVPPWVSGGPLSDDGANTSCELWYYPNCPAGITSVTVPTDLNTNIGVTIAEFSGVRAVSPLGNAAPFNQAALTGTPTVAAVAPVTDEELFVAGTVYRPTTSTLVSEDAGWNALTARTAGAVVRLLTSYRVESDGVSRGNTWVLTPAGSTGYSSVLSGFKGVAKSVGGRHGFAAFPRKSLQRFFR